jgi:hypothetical protein
MPRKKKPEATLPRRDGELEPAWSSAPDRLARYTLYCDHTSGRRWVTNSFGIYAARKIYDALTGTGKGVPRGKDTIQFGDVTIRSDELQDIISYKLTAAEREWVLPIPYPETISQFLTGVRRPQ